MAVIKKIWVYALFICIFIALSFYLLNGNPTIKYFIIAKYGGIPIVSALLAIIWYRLIHMLPDKSQNKATLISLFIALMLIILIAYSLTVFRGYTARELLKAYAEYFSYLLLFLLAIISYSYFWRLGASSREAVAKKISDNSTGTKMLKIILILLAILAATAGMIYLMEIRIYQRDSLWEIVRSVITLPIWLSLFYLLLILKQVDKKILWLSVILYAVLFYPANWIISGIHPVGLYTALYTLEMAYIILRVASLYILASVATLIFLFIAVETSGRKV